jgi:magnesium-transporting ATPase (P-type)
VASAELEPHPPPPAPAPEAWFAQDEAAVVAALETDADQGLSQAEAAARLARDGANEITGEKPPSVWHVALEQPLGLATLLPLVIEGRKWLLRRRAPHAEVLDVQRAVAPDRAGAR